MRADDFVMIKCIGRGAFGEVQLVRSADSCCSDVCTGTTREIHVNHMVELMMVFCGGFDEDEDVATDLLMLWSSLVQYRIGADSMLSWYH